VLDTSARLLELLSLLQARRDWAGPELAARLEVGVRTIRRDVERLRALGYPVQARRGVAGGYRLAAGASLPPLLLDEGEAVAVAVGLRTAASAGVAGIEQTSVRALAKLEQVLPAGVRRRVTAIGSATVPYRGSGPEVDGATLAAIASACRDSDRVRFTYRNHRGEESRREVEPLGLVHTGRRWYLVAWDTARGGWRSFRVDRVAPGLRTGGGFVPRTPPAEDLASYVSEGVSAARDRYRAEVLLHAPLAEVADRVPPGVGTLEAIDERSCLLRAGSDWLGGLAVYVAEIGVEFTVLEPPEFAERVRRLAGRFERASTAH
jgi:predicted DNA-binding transcriptional regulator YafY